MLTTRTRKQGSSIVVTLPVSDKINLETNQDYIVTYQENGTIILVPQIADPFTIAEAGAYYEGDEWKDIQPLGDEVL